MVVIEGTLALTGARFIIRTLKERRLAARLPPGFTAVNRDESRHVGFGVKFLADAIKDDPRNAQIDRGHAQGDAAGRTLALSPPWWTTPTTSRRRSATTRREIFEYAMKSLSKKLAAMGMEPAMLAGAGVSRRPRRARRPGRPSTGARERILEAGLEVLKARRLRRPDDAKVAARSGQNKALISYHFGSKQGLVAAVGARGGRADHRGGARRDRRAARRSRSVVRGVARRRRRVIDARRAAWPRLYFDLAAVLGGRARGARDHAEMKEG